MASTFSPNGPFSSTESKLDFYKRRKPQRKINFHFLLSLSRSKLDSITPSSIWQPSPSLLNKNNALPGFSSGGWSSVLSPGMVPPPPVGQEDGERPHAGCMLLLSHLLVKMMVSDPRQAACRRPVCLPASHSTKGSSLPGRSLWPLSFERWWILHCSTLLPD